MKALSDYEPYRELTESIAQLKSDLTKIESKIAEFGSKDSVTAQAESLIAGGSLEEVGKRQQSLEALTEKRQVLSRALSIQENELATGRVKPQAKLFVRESLLQQQREIAADLKVTIENLLKALKPAADFQDDLFRSDVGIGEPLRHLLLTENTGENLRGWLAENHDFAEEAAK